MVEVEWYQLTAVILLFDLAVTLTFDLSTSKANEFILCPPNAHML